MAERQPLLLGDSGNETPDPPAPVPTEPPAARAAEPPPTRTTSTVPPPLKREAAIVRVVGFWRRLVAAAIDAIVIVPAALLITAIASKIAGIHLPAGKVHLLDVDLWIDLVLATEPALVMGLVLLVAVALLYLLVFQIALGRTLGMRLLRIKIIDVYGDRPSPARCAVRVIGYVVSLASLMLGFLWIGFDSEKRGLHDWIAGTYVIRA